ncbi:MAG: GntR family transcriptional regulator [Acuticoccus sp.]
MATETVAKRNAAARSRAPRPIGRRSQAVFAALQRDILLGHLKPRDVLLELELAHRFDCSQSTVREALLRLQEDGLVIRISQRGTLVADCNGDDARELLRIRHDIECRGVQRALARYDGELRATLLAELEAMRDAARDGDEFALSVHDRTFHLTLFAAAELPAVQPMLSRCLLHNHRYKIASSEPNRDLDETAERHSAIIEALDDGKPEIARAALSHHIATIVDFGPSIIQGEAEQ